VRARLGNTAALEQLLLESYGGKVGWGLALKLQRVRNLPDVWNLYLPRSSRAILKKMKPSLKRGVMQAQTLVCSRRT